MTITYKSHVPDLILRLRTTARGATGAAAECFAHEYKSRLLRSGPPSSRPGEIPHYDSSRGGESIAWQQVNDNRAEVGMTGLAGVNRAKPHQYMRWLDSGTSRVAARPWIRVIFQSALPIVRQCVDGYLRQRAA